MGQPQGSNINPSTPEARMTGSSGGSGRSTDSRLELLEYRAGEAARDIERLRNDMKAGFEGVNEKLEAGNTKMGRQLFATWMLVAALLSASAAIFAALR